MGRQLLLAALTSWPSSQFIEIIRANCWPVRMNAQRFNATYPWNLTGAGPFTSRRLGMTGKWEAELWVVEFCFG
jgi:hypothetical protein